MIDYVLNIKIYICNKYAQKEYKHIYRYTESGKQEWGYVNTYISNKFVRYWVCVSWWCM